MQRFLRLFVCLLTFSFLLSGCAAVQAIKGSSPLDASTAFFDALKLQDMEVLAKIYSGDVKTLEINKIDEFINETFEKQTEKAIQEKLLGFTFTVGNEVITEPEAPEEEDKDEEKDKEKDKTKEKDKDKEKDKAKDKEKDKAKDAEATKSTDAAAKDGENAAVAPTTATIDVVVTTINYGQVVNDSLKKYFEEMAATANLNGPVDNSIYQLEKLTKESTVAAKADYEAKFTINLTKKDKEWKVDVFPKNSAFFNAYYGNVEGTVPAPPPQPAAN